MLKITGSIMIVICSYITGKTIISCKNEKMITKENLITFFKVLKEQLSTNFNDISMAIDISCEKTEFIYNSEFACFANTIQNSDVNTFKDAYEYSKDKYSENAKIIIEQFADKLDENGMFCYEKSCDEMINSLSEKYEKEKLKVDTDNRIILNFSICAGLIIVILLI